jgi:hypothetical protein
MTDLQRVKEAASELKLSLEAVASVKNAELPPRPLSEAVAEWRDGPPLTVSRALLETLKPKEPSDV